MTPCSLVLSLSKSSFFSSAVVLGGSFVFASRAVTRSRNSLMLLVTSFIGVGIGFMAFSDSAVLQVMAIWVVKFPWRDTKSNIFLGNIITASWGPWKHPDPAPGGRPIFFKPEWPKESKNGFKTISCCPYRKVIFSNYFFRHQKSSKKWDGFTSNQFPSHLNSIKCSINIFSDIRTT